MDCLNRKDEIEIEVQSKQYFPESVRTVFDPVLYQSNLTEKLPNRSIPWHSEHHLDFQYAAYGQKYIPQSPSMSD